ncbi:MAG TPA: T9SS type A sorting domain-containing protein [Saprospiraceae bacterium]|nr:T9SS type A sorting domain-containing protein [Saprospiraceae bacterium]
MNAFLRLSILLFWGSFSLFTQKAVASIGISDIIPSSSNNICDGSFTVVADGTAGPFIIIIYNGSHSDFIPFSYYEEGNNLQVTIPGLCPGAYTIEVTDAFGCKKTILTSVPVVCDIEITEEITPACSMGGGSIEVTPLSGVAPYSYEWRDAQGNTIPYAMPSLSSVPPGDYTLIITDVNSCSTTRGFTIPDALFEVQEFYYEYPCKNGGNSYGRIAVAAFDNEYRGPYTFNWNNGEKIEETINLSFFDKAAAGVNTVLITDKYGCQVSKEIFMEESELIVQADVSQPCDAGIDITVGNLLGTQSKYFFQWSNGAKTEDISNLSPGEYCVTITENISNCTAVVCRDITVGALSVNIREIRSAIFAEGGAPKNNGFAKVQAEGGTAPYSYLWDNGATTNEISNLLPGTYIVTVTDANGCMTTRSVVVGRCDVSRAALTVEIGPNNVKPCDGGAGSISPVIKGGNTNGFYSDLLPLYYTYQWSGPNGFSSNEKNISNLKVEGNYCITVTDECGNTASNCQYITCDCPDIKLEYSVFNRCLIGWPWRKKPNVTFHGIHGSLESNYPMLDEIVLDDRDYEFVIDWNGNNWRSNNDGSLSYHYDGSGSDFDGKERFELSSRDKQTVELTVTDFLGCQYTEYISFSKESFVAEFVSETLDNFHPTLAGLGWTADTKTRWCQQCGGVCHRSDRTNYLEYRPNNKNEPCNGGGTLYNTPVGAIAIPRGSLPTEFVNYENVLRDKNGNKRMENGLCVYEAGCYFPLGSIEHPKVDNAIYVTTEKLDDCSLEANPDIDYGDDRCGGPIITRYLGNCSFEKVCRKFDTENGETVTLGNYSVPGEYCYLRNLEIGVVRYDIYSFCRVDGKIISGKIEERITSNRGYQECNTNPLTNPDEKLDLKSIIGGDPSIQQGQVLLGKDLNKVQLDIEIFEQTLYLIDFPDLEIETEELQTQVTNIYPNPFRDILYIEYTSEENVEVQVKLVNAIGKIVLVQTFGAAKGTNKFSIETKNNVALGMYYLVVIDQNGHYSIHKIVHW